MRTVPAAHLPWSLIDQENPREVAIWAIAQGVGPREWTIEEVAEALPVADPQIADTLAALASESKIRCVGTGRYRLQATDDEFAAANSS